VTDTARKTRSWAGGQPFSGAGLQVRLIPIVGWTDKKLMPGEFHFQCPPLEEFKRSYVQNWNDYDSLAGPRSRPQSRALTQIQFSTLFVGLLDHSHGYSWTVVDPAPINFDPRFEAKAPNAHVYTDMLYDVLRAATPFRLVVGNPNLWNRPDLDMAATLRQLDVAERAGEVEARYAEVTFVEFRDPDLELPSLGDFAKTRGENVTLRIVNLKEDRRTLAQLALWYYGDPTRWREIVAANPFLKGTGQNVNVRQKFLKSKTHRSITIPKVVVLG
jgi:hypothetical protein